MKKLLFVLIGISIFGLELVNAQNIPSTAGASNSNTLPSGWEPIQGSGAYTSSRTQYGGIQIGGAQVFYTPMIPQLPSGANTFVSLHGGAAGANITGLIAGKKYKFNYSVISAQTDYNVNGSDHSDYFSSAINFKVVSGSIDNIGGELTRHEVHFNKITENGTWKTGAFEFTATKSTAFVKFEELSGFAPGFVGLDLDVNAVQQCNAGVDQVPVAATAEILCPATSLNLVTETFQGLIPAGLQLKYFTTPDRSTLPLTNLNVGAGTYYAFYYDETNNCYNTKYSTAKIDVTYKPCADLTPTISIGSLSFSGGVAKDFVVNLFENNGSPTSGNVSFRITKLGGFNITYPTVSGTSSVFGGIANQNSNWTFSETAQFITVSSTVPIPAKGKAVIGFNIKRKPGIVAGLTQNMTPTILSGAGGEQNSKNNSIATSASTN